MGTDTLLGQFAPSLTTSRSATINLHSVATDSAHPPPARASSAQQWHDRSRASVCVLITSMTLSELSPGNATHPVNNGRLNGEALPYAWSAGVRPARQDGN